MPENIGRSFLVRVWLEPREIPNESEEWRGMIQDVMSGERKYFRRFDEMIRFVIVAILLDIQKTKGAIH
jgi:hypothetical protein